MAPPSPDFEKSFWRFEKILHNLERVVTSWFTTPLVLLIIRSIFLTYSLITLALSIYVEFGRGRLHTYLTYFANLGFIGLTVYFAVAVVHSLIFVIYDEPKSLSTQPRALTIAFWILYDVVVVYHILIPIFYWAILVPSRIEEFNSSPPLLTFHEISIHSVDLFMIIVEVVLSRMPLVSSHLIFVLTILIFYLFETWISYAINNTFPYRFLDWREGQKVAGYYFGVMGIAINAFLIQKLIHMIRDVIGRRTWRKGLMHEMEGYPRAGGNRSQQSSVGRSRSRGIVVRSPANEISTCTCTDEIEMQARA
ncbi:3788_t:CDS:2 [Ambispora gerdemannii]|uniref:3788_t:CDS:1 n=1 Tax=Ambispora gerdemannii TaxID=144530 RepID=A0A9N9GB99_9GLOM|nr:3788_t:CDS:2 [Ambispora gerdemannii]